MHKLLLAFALCIWSLASATSATRAVDLPAEAARAVTGGAEARATKKKPRVLINADTANEVDDLYAIARALVEPSIELVGLSSAQWQVSHYATPHTLEDSQRMNEVLLALLNRKKLPHPRGATARLFDWGDRAQHSAAAYQIIREAHATPTGQKLIVVMLGANTDLASALLIDPAIAPKLKVYLLGTSYDHARRIWRKRDFNCVMDIQAIEVVLDAKELETHIMPVNIAAPLVFELSEVKRRFAGKNDLFDLLLRRWQDHIDGARLRRTIWDLALVSCLIRPELGQETEATTPPENTQRNVHVFIRIDAQGIRSEFFSSLERHFEAQHQ